MHPNVMSLGTRHRMAAARRNFELPRLQCVLCNIGAYDQREHVYRADY